ncbi:hypothetical protein GCM10027275_40760 [Rhabdobacter roseus]|uniref:DUF4822 domain-containing protein n=1 Tax=Rhabdobacter roseus TaxID=1655419 RepID=A0A840U1P2_9BACT|nr:hypothetical protein [Rhabdobacter roseus]MBB5286050.1 hypothetical protein [Rhabdobacter roseus]
MRYATLLLLSTLALSSCRRAASTVEDAQARLLAPDHWQISEVYINDALSYKDGKTREHFGGVNFNRYMEKVYFRPEGTFEGYYKGETEAKVLRWSAQTDQILVAAPDDSTQAGAWSIRPGDVYDDSFEMKVQSTAYDYPNLTRIALKFVKAER